MAWVVSELNYDVRAGTPLHMGGRVYDPTIGRFLSADLFVQSPYSTQSYNRYSYVMNNPLGNIDPSGYCTVTTKYYYTVGVPNSTHAYDVDVSPDCGNGGGITDLNHGGRTPVKSERAELPQIQIRDDYSNGIYCPMCHMGEGYSAASADGEPIDFFDVLDGAADFACDLTACGLANLASKKDVSKTEAGFVFASAISYAKWFNKLSSSIKSVKTAGQLGREGEAAVRAKYDIGAIEKTQKIINGRIRYPDGYIPGLSISEIKNTGRQAFTSQLRDNVAIAMKEGIRNDLYVRTGNGTKLTGPLADAVNAGLVNLIKAIPY